MPKSPLPSDPGQPCCLSASPRSTAPTDLPQAPSGSAPPFFVVPPPLSPRENRGAVGSGRRDPRADRAPSGRRGATVAKATGGPRAGRRREAGSGGWEAGWEGACVRGPAPAAPALLGLGACGAETPPRLSPPPNHRVLATEHAQPPLDSRDQVGWDDARLPPRGPSADHRPGWAGFPVVGA